MDTSEQVAQLAVTAWEQAVNGEGTLLASLADAGVVDRLLHPWRKPWQVAPGPQVRVVVGTAGDDGEVRVRFEFTGRQAVTDPGQAERGGYRINPDRDVNFTGTMSLARAGSGTGPWRLTSGSVQTLDDYLGYVFTYRAEGRPGYVPPVPGGRRFRIVAGFAEHDEKFGSHGEVEVIRDDPPGREEAVRLVWPDMEAEAERVLGPGDWRLSLNWVDVIEMRSGPAVVNPDNERRELT